MAYALGRWSGNRLLTRICARGKVAVGIAKGDRWVALSFYTPIFTASVLTYRLADTDEGPVALPFGGQVDLLALLVDVNTQLFDDG